ncbi:hydantoinase/oxoprolinase family protein [Streptomyces sp. NPDC127166]|uniref:hydantoinase/oxoprolinase family protein n=1 Tax=Streptomyces sp. NPDC127166 TaxID=3345380 RepID=UPI0036356BFE
MRLGIDLGRATCVAVLLDHDGRTVADAVVDSRPGTAESVRGVLAELGPVASAAESVALVTDLARRPPRPERVALLRIAPTSHPALAPLADWPARARAAVDALTAVVPGGAMLTGRPPSPLNRAAAAAFAQRAEEAEISTFAVCAAGAPAEPGPELDAAAVLADTVPGAAISLSHELGSVGLRERENATVVNAALGGWAAELAAEAARALRSAGLTAPLFFARDDGGLISAEYFRRHPVIATVPATTYAALGAAARAGVADAVVVDAGARSVRCLSVVDGTPERSVRPGPGPLGVPMQLGSPAIHEVGPGVHHTYPEDPRDMAHVTARQLERLAGAVLLHTGGGAESVGAPPAAADARARLTDAARFAATSVCRIEFEQLVAAAGRAEFEQRLATARDRALSRVVAAGAAPDTARIESVSHASVAYLPAGVHRVTVRAVGRPTAGVAV